MTAEFVDVHSHHRAVRGPVTEFTYFSTFTGIGGFVQ